MLKNDLPAKFANNYFMIAMYIAMNFIKNVIYIYIIEWVLHMDSSVNLDENYLNSLDLKEYFKGNWKGEACGAFYHEGLICLENLKNTGATNHHTPHWRDRDFFEEN